MEFLIIVLVWVLYSVFDFRLPKDVDNWYSQWVGKTRNILGEGKLHACVRILIPIILVAVVLYFFRNTLFGLVELVLGVLIFIYSVGRTDVNRAVREHQVKMQEGDLQAAYRAALGNFVIDNMDESVSRIELHRSVRRALVLNSFDLWFAPMFWLVLLGPAGALFYRLSSLDYQTSKSPSVKQVLHALNFLPGRLLVLTFALVGNFVGAAKRFLESLVEFSISSVNLLDMSALHATGRAPKGLDADPEVSDDIFAAAASNEIELVSGLMQRCVIAWLAIIAIAAVLGF